MQTQAKLETAMTLGIIAATPGYQPKDPYSISELEKASARAQKEIDFLNRIKSASTTETLKAKAKALLQAPTQSTSDDFRNVLTMYIKQVKGDLIAPLWKEMVPMTYTDKSLTLVRQLEQQATKM